MSDDYNMENTGNAEEVLDVWDVFHFTRDKKGRNNWIKLGRAWAKDDEDSISVKLYAYPLQNVDGECWIKLVPFDPEWKRNR